MRIKGGNGGAVVPETGSVVNGMSKGIAQYEVSLSDEPRIGHLPCQAGSKAVVGSVRNVLELRQLAVCAIERVVSIAYRAATISGKKIENSVCSARNEWIDVHQRSQAMRTASQVAELDRRV